MNIPGLPDDGHDLRAGLDQSPDVRIIFWQSSCPAGASEGDDLRTREGNRFDLLKELEVLWVGTRPSPFDVVDAQFVQLLGDSNFILNRKRDVFCLRPIAKCGVVDFYRIGMIQNENLLNSTTIQCTINDVEVTMVDGL